MGNLMLMRVTSQIEHSSERKAEVIAHILFTLAGLGISPDKNMEDTIRSN